MGYEGLRSLRNVSVWAYQAEFPTMCGDPHRFTRGLRYPDGNKSAQGGWHLAIRFRDLDDLAAQLRRGVEVPGTFYDGFSVSGAPTLQRGEIARLAIMAHGDQGGLVAVEGLTGRRALMGDNIMEFHTALHTIGLYTKPNLSTILFTGCLAGQGDDGTRLLKGLSRVWPGRLVVAFTTLGYRHPPTMTPVGEACRLPGMRETDAPGSQWANPTKFDRLWGDFDRMPWASEYSRYAKAVRNEIVVKCPVGDTCNIPPERVFHGTPPHAK